MIKKTFDYKKKIESYQPQSTLEEAVVCASRSFMTVVVRIINEITVSGKSVDDIVVDGETFSILEDVSFFSVPPVSMKSNTSKKLSGFIMGIPVTVSTSLKRKVKFYANGNCEGILSLIDIQKQRKERINNLLDNDGK